jgi:cytochrome b561
MPSQTTTPPARYDRSAITFHWTMAALIAVVGTLGLVHDSFPKQSHNFWINVHALIGLCVWVLLIARFSWRQTHPPPALPPGSGELARRFARPVHLLLYALIFITPVLGFVSFVWHGRVFDFGVFRVDLGVTKNRAIYAPTEDIHGYLAYALFTLVGVHVAAALWHHFYRHDRLLARIWPAGRSG